MSALIMLSLDMGGTESGVGPVGPGAGSELMLLYIGRCLIWGTTVAWGLYGGLAG